MKINDKLYTVTRL